MSDPRAQWLAHSAKKTVAPDALPSLIERLRREKKSIATINGSFDLLHAGHLFMLYEAKQAADILIVALNSDTSIHAYKSPERPIIPLALRVEMMTAIEFVDFVTWFDEVDPRGILEKIRPDVHVNGAEYGENCVEADTVKKHGGRLLLLPRIGGLATSEIINKIRNLKTP